MNVPLTPGHPDTESIRIAQWCGEIDSIYLDTSFEVVEVSHPLVRR